MGYSTGISVDSAACRNAKESPVNVPDTGYRVGVCHPGGCALGQLVGLNLVVFAMVVVHCCTGPTREARTFTPYSNDIYETSPPTIILYVRGGTLFLCMCEGERRFLMV